MSISASNLTHMYLYNYDDEVCSDFVYYGYADSWITQYDTLETSKSISYFTINNDHYEFGLGCNIPINSFYDTDSREGLYFIEAGNANKRYFFAFDKDTSENLKYIIYLGSNLLSAQLDTSTGNQDLYWNGKKILTED